MPKDQDRVTKAATPEEIAAHEAAKKAKAEAPKVTRLNAEKTETYTLLDPLAFDGKEYRVATLRPFRGKDYETFMIAQAIAGATQALIHCTTDLPLEVCTELGGDDFMELQERTRPFLPAKMREEIESQMAAASAQFETTH